MPGLLSAVLHCREVYDGMGCFWHKHNSEMVLTSLLCSDSLLKKKVWDLWSKSKDRSKSVFPIIGNS